MRCTVCGNDRFFFVSGRDVRRIDTANPYEVETFFVPTDAVCMNPTCPKFSQGGTHVDLGPVHQDLLPVAAALGLSR